MSVYVSVCASARSFLPSLSVVFAVNQGTVVGACACQALARLEEEEARVHQYLNESTAPKVAEVVRFRLTPFLSRCCFELHPHPPPGFAKPCFLSSTDSNNHPCFVH